MQPFYFPQPRPRLDNYPIPSAGLATQGCRVFERVAVRQSVAGVRVLWWQGAVVALILAAQVVGTYAGVATMAALVLWACRNTRCALQSITISILVTFANPGLVGDRPFVSQLKWVVLFTALARVVAGWKYQPRTMSKWCLWFSLFVTVALGLAIAVSDNRQLSLLKLATFSIGVAAALVGVRDRRYAPQYWINWFITVSVVVLALSVPLRFLSAGTYRNGVGFQGILSHPQSYAVYVLPVAVYLTAMYLVEHRGSWFVLTVLPWAWYSIFASGCRTAFVAAGLSAIATAVSLVAFPRVAQAARLRRSITPTLCFVGIFGLIVIATSTSTFSRALDAFIAKGDNGTLASSRRIQVDNLLASIHKHPATGVGFGVSEASAEQFTERDEITGLAVSAPTEQGFLPLAVLAQLGVIGAVPLAAFFLVLAIPIIKHGSAAVVAMFWSALFINFGEMIFFSTGGLGMHMWLVFACCYGHSVAHMRTGQLCS